MGSLAEFRFGEWGDFVLRFELAELDEGSKVHWIHRLSPGGQWAGTSITWQLTPISNGTQVVFTHDGFVKKGEAYERARAWWEHYLETGKGSPGLLVFV